MVKVDKKYVFEGPDGQVTLAGLFREGVADRARRGRDR